LKKEEYLQINKHIIDQRAVLDLACHDGESTKILQDLGARHVYALDIRSHLINDAKNKIKGNVDFFVHDITDYDFLIPLVDKSQTVILLGVFYHLFDHFRFLSNILQPNIEYVLIETVCGPETMNPEMYWGFEPTDQDQNGWAQGLSVIPNGTPNLSWIVQSSRIFGFDLDWIHYYGAAELKERNNVTTEEYISIAGPDWPSYLDIVSGAHIPEFVDKELQQMLREFPRQHRRMILRLYNSNTVNSNPLALEDCYVWPH
jgi:SAM-dependent methyltransferase